MRRSVLLTAAIALTVAYAAPVAQTTPSLAIKGGTVLTVTRGTIPNGTVVLANGRITAVGGPETPIPAGAEVIDATGRFVSPGIIDAHSHIAADSINEGGTTVSSMTGIEDVLNATDINIFRDLAGGLTVANILHGSANPIGGTNAVIKLRWGSPRAADLLFEGAMPGIKFALGENPKDMRFGGGGQQQQQQPPRRYPATRLGVEFVIRDAFTRAKAYQQEWQAYEQARAAGADVLAPRRDLQLEPLVEILEGKRLVHAHCYRADEILMLIRLAEEMGFRIATFQHVLEGYKVADEIAAHGAGASTFSDWWAYKVEAEDATPYNAALMTRRGVLVSINSDSAEHARRLTTEAAKSIHWGGLNEDEALALVTINPAKQLRIDDRLGSLEEGKDADVVVWNHHPLSNYAIVDRVYIDGTLYYDRLAEERRLTEARSEKTRLAAAEGRSAPTTEPQTSPQPREGRSPRTGTAQTGSGGTSVPPARDEAATRSGGTLGPPARDEAATRNGGTLGPPARDEAATRNGGTLGPPARDEAATRNGGTSVPPGRDHLAPGGPSTDEAAGLGGVAMQPQAPAAPVTAIVNARLHPMSAPTIERGTLVMRGGRIEAIGADVQAPPGAQVIDAAGADVYPGFIDGRTTLGLNEPGPRGFEDINEMLDLNAAVKAQVAYHWDSDAIPVARVNGITTVAVVPAGGLLGGQIAVMNLDGWSWEEAAVKPVAGVTFQFPAVVPGGGGGGFGPNPNLSRRHEDLLRERDARVKTVEDLLAQARAYAAMPASERRTDWNFEALIPIVERRLPLFVQATREEEIRDAVAFADRANVRIVITGGSEAPLVAPLLKENEVPVILGSVLGLPTREDFHHAASYRAAGELAAAGVTFAFATGSYQNPRLLPYEAAISVAWGLDRDRALRALTLDAAEILGVAESVGSLAPGKMANVVIWQGDPLELRTPLPRVFIAGRDVGPDNKHLRLYEKFNSRPTRSGGTSGPPGAAGIRSGGTSGPPGAAGIRSGGTSVPPAGGAR